jgi:hypothetical protein
VHFSEVHGDAEATIRYFVGKLQEQHVFEAMAFERPRPRH